MIACLAQDGFCYHNFPNLDLDPKTYSSHLRAHSPLGRQVISIPYRKYKSYKCQSSSKENKYSSIKTPY